jgi:hypothetical protein
MPVQVKLDIDVTPFVTYTFPGSRQDDAVISQDVGRTEVLAKYTLMSKIAASGKWTPFVDETATDGTAIPAGIYMGDDIAAADLVAGDVVDNPIIVNGIKFDKDKLVIENSKLLTTIIAATTVNAKTVNEVLVEKQLIPELVAAVSANA